MSWFTHALGSHGCRSLLLTRQSYHVVAREPVHDPYAAIRKTLPMFPVQVTQTCYCGAVSVHLPEPPAGWPLSGLLVQQ